MKYPSSDPMIIYFDLCFYLNSVLISGKDSLVHKLFSCREINDSNKASIISIIESAINENFKLTDKIDKDVDFQDIQTWIGEIFERINVSLFELYSRFLLKKELETFKFALNDELVEKQKQIQKEMSDKIHEDYSITWIFFNVHFEKFNIFNTNKNWDLY